MIQFEPGVARWRGWRRSRVGRSVPRGASRGLRHGLRSLHRLDAPAEEARHQEFARQTLQQEGEGWNAGKY